MPAVAAAVDLPEVAGPARVGHRLVGVDVARAVALIGVVAMNYTEAFNGEALSRGGVGDGPSWLQTVFHPYHGPLSTRFAATLVTLAGVGVALLARRGGGGADDRWQLRRRGVLLFAVGFAFEWVWPGQILSYYGALLVLGSFLLRVPSGLLLAGAAAVAALSGVTASMHDSGHDWSWLLLVASDSPRNLVFNTVVNGTHPLVPWAAFFLVGMVLGRLDLGSADVRRRLLLGGAGLVGAGYGLSTVLDADAIRVRVFTYTPLYAVAAVGSSTAAIALLVALAERWRGSPVVALLARAGQLTLSLYLLHAFVANVLIDWADYEDIGLVPALAVALAYWVAGMALASWWRASVGPGPAEWAYRRFGG